MNRWRLPGHTLGLGLAGVLFAAAIAVFFLVPRSRQAAQLQAEIDRLRESLALRRQLEPVAASLGAALAALPAAPPETDGARLPLADIGRLGAIFDGMAAPLGVRLSRVAPDPASVTSGKLLAVRLELVGPPAAFREFLLALGRFGPLVKIASASTVAGRDGREYAVQCWLAVQ